MTGTLRCIVVGVDGSPDARAALGWAVALAAPTGARVVAVHALGLLDRLDGVTVASAAHRDEITEVFRRDWCAPLDATGAASARLVVDGPPADVLLTAARDHAADVVVVGARGAGGRSDLTLGSTSHRVVADAPCPVLVVPRPAGAPGA